MQRMLGLFVGLMLTVTLAAPASASALTDRRIIAEATIAAPVGDVWAAWTTKEGLESFFAKQANIELVPHGSYEILFNPDAPPGQRGSEGGHILGFETERMLSFEWTNTPAMTEIRPHFTHVVIYFEPVGERETRVTLIHSGFGIGGEWETSFGYFGQAWPTVLGWLGDRFSKPQ